MKTSRSTRKTPSQYPLPAGIVSLGVIIFLIASLVAAPQPVQAVPMVKVLIGVTHQPGPSEENLVRKAGGRIKYTYHLIPAIAATVPETAITTLLAEPVFTRVDADLQIRANDVEIDGAWGVKRIGAGTVHDAGNKGARVRIAVLDTGIDYNHPDLRANFAGGRDFVNNDSDPLDDNGHGTHVAGIIAARDDGAGVVGVAPEAQIYALKIMDANGSGDSSSIIAALEWAVDNRIQVTNNSYGTALDPGELAKAAFDQAAKAGVLHIAAAGNNGDPLGLTDTVDFPARWDSVVAVAATGPDNTRAFFSSTGPLVRLAAPGFQIPSTFLGGLYAVGSGTSMATPHVTGAAALAIASGIIDANANGRTNDEVEQRLITTADDLGPAGRDAHFGFGEVNTAKAAALPGPPNSAPMVFISSPLLGSTFPSGEVAAFSGASADIEDGLLTASLAWRSDLDGPLGTGGSLSAALRDGSHTITASVTDSAGTASSLSVKITVGAASLPPLGVSVASEQLVYRDRDTAKVVTTVTQAARAIPEASISFVVDTPNGTRLFGSGTTDGKGVARFETRLNAPRDGLGVYTVHTTATKEGFTSASGAVSFIAR